MPSLIDQQKKHRGRAACPCMAGEPTQSVSVCRAAAVARCGPREPPTQRLLLQCRPPATPAATPAAAATTTTPSWHRRCRMCTMSRSRHESTATRSSAPQLGPYLWMYLDRAPVITGGGSVAHGRNRSRWRRIAPGSHGDATRGHLRRWRQPRGRRSHRRGEPARAQALPTTTRSTRGGS